MTFAIAVMTDGRRDYLSQTLASCEVALKGEFSPCVMIDDSGDAEYANWLHDRFPMFRIVHHAQRLGFGATVRDLWAVALEREWEFLWHQEEDFTFNEAIDVPTMAEVLGCRDDLAQIVLKRQPWSNEEKDAGGQIELAEREGDRFEEVRITVVDELVSVSDEPVPDETEVGWITEHHRNFSTNPSLVTRRAIELCVATGEPCTEGLITKVCLENGLHFAYWGRKADAPRAHHIGEHRSQGWFV